ncbi:uncharacterized protein ACRADG_003985 [Cochliomyia hominivorax]
MDSKLFTNFYNSSSNNEWYFVQYDRGPQKFVRTIVRPHDIMWNEHLQIPSTQNNETQHQQQQQQQKEHVLIRDQEQIFLGYIINKAINKQHALNQKQFLQQICMQLLHSPYEMKNIMEQIHFNHNFWLLVLYSTGPVTTACLSDEWGSAYGIFHKNDVILKKEYQSPYVIAYVQEEDMTHKGIVIKVTNDLSDLMLIFGVIKNDVVRAIKEYPTIDHEKKNKKFMEEIKKMEQRMYKESNLLLKAFQAVDKRKIRLKHRLLYLENLKKMNNIEE